MTTKTGDVSKTDIPSSKEKIYPKIADGDGLNWWQRRRYWICLLTFLGYFISYLIRTNLSIAIVAMTKPEVNRNGTIIREADFDWDGILQGHILSAFFYGYLTTQLLGGWLSARFGGHLMLAEAVGVPALLTLFTPLAANIGQTGMIAIRVLMGVFSGPAYPCNHSVWAKWAPPSEKNALMSFALTGTNVGTLLMMFIGGLIADYLGWRYLFYITGGVGVLWTLVWLIVVRESPEKDPYINDKELEFIKRQLDQADSENDKGGIVHPWKEIFTSSAVWAHVISLICCHWGFYTLLTQIPRYFSDVLGFDMITLGLTASIPYLALALMLPASGRLADYLIAKKGISSTLIRKIWLALGFLGLSLFLLLQLTVHSQEGIVSLLTAALALQSFVFGVVMMNPLDLGRDHASVIFGFSNTFGCIVGIISPIVAGYLTQDKSQEGWMYVFFIIIGLSIFATIIYSIFGSGERQTWAKNK